MDDNRKLDNNEIKLILSVWNFLIKLKRITLFRLEMCVNEFSHLDSYSKDSFKFSSEEPYNKI